MTRKKYLVFGTFFPIRINSDATTFLAFLDVLATLDVIHCDTPPFICGFM